MAVAPVVILWYVWYRQGLWRLTKWALAVVGGVVGALLAVGIVISLKIGGGSNLHNLDMALIAIVFATVVLWRQGGGDWLMQSHRWDGWAEAVLVVLVIVPMYFVFLAARPRHIPEARWWKPALQAVQSYVHNAHASGEEVLFMDQRQLLTFGYVEKVPLVAEYEKKRMMDEAMANDASYFAQYYRDLSRHRFAVIITEPLKVKWASEQENNFAAENNAWVKWVAKPTLCYYRVASKFPAAGIEILVPRDEEHPACEQTLPVPPSR